MLLASVPSKMLLMGRTPCIPPQLKAAPFTLDEARRFGLTPDVLRGKAWRRIATELYCWQGIEVEPWPLLAAWVRLLPPSAAFAGKTAAWMLGLDFDPAGPVEVVVPPGVGVRSRTGVALKRCLLAARDLRRERGLRLTTLQRTLRDLCARWPPGEALVAIDMALHRRLTDLPRLAREAAAAKGRHGARRLADMARIAAPAESPMETRLRWLLLQAGLPRPEVQIDLRDVFRNFVGRADLFYRHAQLVVEFDGGNHRERLAASDRRQNLLINAGFRILRVTSADVYQRPEAVTDQVRGALGWNHGNRVSGARTALRWPQ